MTIRALIRLRAFFAILFAVALLATSVPRVAHAANPYERTDGQEGDPGDGVLDPRYDGGGSGDSHNPEIIVSGSVVRGSDGPALLLPVFLPANGTGRFDVLYVPLSWWRPLLPDALRDGRWHDAP